MKTMKISMSIKTVATLFVVFSVFACVVGFSACVDDKNADVDCEHKNITWSETVDATCTEDGYKIGICDDCGKEVTEAVFSTGEHNYVVDTVNSTEATCVADGVTFYICSMCGDTSKLSEIVPATGEHIWDNGEVAKAATYDEEGEILYTCTICGATKVETTDKLIRELEYALNDDKTGYIVTGIGSVVDADIVIPSAHEGLPVVAIGDRVFYGRTSLTSVTIPESVTGIGDRAFYNCSSLTEINFKATSMADLTSGSDVFYHAGTGTDTTVTVGTNVQSIPSYLFEDSYIANVVFEDNSVCESIGERAFYSCGSLTSITIPESVTTIGDNALCFCTSLTEINFKATSMADLTLSDSNIFSFSGTGTDMTVIFGSNVQSIPSYLFEDSYIANVVFEDNSVCESIGEWAFGFCTSLTSITIPESVTTIGDNAFCYCMSLTEINFKATSMTDLTSGSGVFYYAGTGTDTTVIVGANVQSIPSYLFYNSNITNVVFEDNSVCESIGERAFYYCRSLTNITIPENIASIGNYAFYDCVAMTAITIPDSVTSIGNSAFEYCTSLTSIIIPDGVISIGSYAFAYCLAATSVTIGKGVESIGSYAFRNCTSLAEIKYYATNANASSSNSNDVFYYAGTSGDELMATIGANVESIPTYMFYYSNITSVLFEEGCVCADIGYRAFNNCSTLKAIYFFGTEDDWAKISIGDGNSPLTSATIYYYSEDDPMGTEENRWHYNEFGEVEIWNKED